jgi:hypothetical protein
MKIGAQIGAQIGRVVLLGAAVAALAGCGGAGAGGTQPALTTAAPPGAATVAPNATPRVSASPGEGYKDDYGY